MDRALSQVESLKRIHDIFLNGESKLLACERSVIAFSNLGAFTQVCEQLGECQVFRETVFGSFQNQISVVHIISAPLYHNAPELLKQTAHVRRTNPMIRMSMFNSLAAECTHLHRLFGNIIVTPVHLVMNDNELDDPDFIAHLKRNVANHFPKTNNVDFELRECRIVQREGLQTQGVSTTTFEALLNELKVDMIYATGGSTHWLNALLMANRVHETLWSSKITESGTIPSKIVWSGSSAGIIVGGATTLVSALKCNYLGHNNCDDVKSAIIKNAANGQSTLCAQTDVENSCVFSACEFDGIGAFNGIFVPHFTDDDIGKKVEEAIGSLLDQTVAEDNSVIARPWARTRMGGRFAGRIMPLADGECCIIQPDGGETRLPTTSALRTLSGMTDSERHFLFNIHRARELTDFSKQQWDRLSEILKANNIPIVNCSQSDKCQR